MPKFATLRLGKDSVDLIKSIDASEPGIQNPALTMDVKCAQVQKEIEEGFFLFIWLGSDNNSGTPTPWVQGLRAIGRLQRIERTGPNFNDQTTLNIDVRILLPRSITKPDFLAKAPTSYYWFSHMPVLGIDDYSNQTIRYINPANERSVLKALFYAIDASSPGFKADIDSSYPELSGMFDYTPPNPLARTSSLSIDDFPEESEVVSSTLLPKMLPVEWILALSSKSFLIVTGTSGTGKTRIARDIARAFDYSIPAKFSASATKPANCAAFIPVGANWQNPTPLLGFRNPFGTEMPLKNSEDENSISNEIYDPPEALLLLLRAVEKPDHPHFLILDEMNLSHVERYFYPFLSIIEANRGLDAQSKIPLIDTDTLQLIARTLDSKQKNPLEASIAQHMVEKKISLSFPDNVFVIGTVNVDETTYMFSPKVLDRAHVIEVRPQTPTEYFMDMPVPSNDLILRERALECLKHSIRRNREGFWERKKPREILHAVAQDRAIGIEEFEEIMQGIQRTLKGLDILLQPAGFGFAFRAVNEFTAYMAVFLELNDGTIFGTDGWKGALDRAVAQKMLPKIHGNRRLLGGCLSALASFLRGKDGINTSFNVGTTQVLIPPGEGLGFELPISATKVEHMDRRLNAIGYTTFVE